MFDKQACTIGIAPISNDHVTRVCEELTKNGVILKSEDFKTRHQRTLKSLVKSWCKKNLGISCEEWDEIKVTKITQTNSE